MSVLFTVLIGAAAGTTSGATATSGSKYGAFSVNHHGDVHQHGEVVNQLRNDMTADEQKKVNKALEKMFNAPPKKFDVEPGHVPKSWPQPQHYRSTSSLAGHGAPADNVHSAQWFQKEEAKLQHILDRNEHMPNAEFGTSKLGQDLQDKKKTSMPTAKKLAPPREPTVVSLVEQANQAHQSSDPNQDDLAAVAREQNDIGNNDQVNDVVVKFQQQLTHFQHLEKASSNLLMVIDDDYPFQCVCSANGTCVDNDQVECLAMASAYRWASVVFMSIFAILF